MGSGYIESDKKYGQLSAEERGKYNGRYAAHIAQNRAKKRRSESH